MPHRLPTTGRYKISNDVLILILENMDPTSLYRICKVTIPRVASALVQVLTVRHRSSTEFASS